MVVNADVELDSGVVLAKLLRGRSLAAIIEPFLPDTAEKPAKWLAEDIAAAILGKVPA